MKKIFKSDKGYVSIFLIIIFTVIFFLNAVLIDYARIIAAKYQTEETVKAAVRSVLSSYDSSLYINYGLFGLSADGVDIFNEVSEESLTNSSGYFNFIKITIEGNNPLIETGHELAYHSVFEQQILEEMKYKAPLDFTLDIIDQFSSLALAMKEASNTTSILTNINDQYETRNQYLSEAINYQKNAVGLVNISNNALDEIISNYYGYKNSLFELNSLSDDGSDEVNEYREELKNNIEQFKQNAINLSNQLYNQFYSQLVNYNNYLGNAETSVNEAFFANEEMKRIIENANSNVIEGQYDRVHSEGIDNDNTGVINNIKTINAIISKNEDMALPDDYFNYFKSDIEEQKQQFQNIVKNLDLLNNQVLNVINNLSSGGLESSVDEIKVILSNYNKFYGDLLNPNNKITKRENELSNIQKEIEPEKKALESEGELNLNTINNLFNLIKTVKNKNEEFTVLDQKFNLYKDFNLNMTTDEIVNPIGNSSTEAVDNAIKEMDGLFSKLANILEEIRNEVYIGEYIFDRFSYFDPANFNELLSFNSNSDNYNNIEIDGDALANLLDVSNQEVEYIIYGLSNAGGNVSSALRDIFYIRLAINMIEAFTNPKVLAATNPLIILLEATVYAISNSITDIIKLMQGKEVPLAKKIQQLRFDYGNYLSLLYLIRGNEFEKLSRIQAIVDYESGKDLTTIPTYVKGDINVSIQLWFIPGVMKVLNYVGILNGQIDKNRYVFSKVSAMSY